MPFCLSVFGDKRSHDPSKETRSKCIYFKNELLTKLQHFSLPNRKIVAEDKFTIFVVKQVVTEKVENTVGK